MTALYFGTSDVSADGAYSSPRGCKDRMTARRNASTRIIYDYMTYYNDIRRASLGAYAHDADHQYAFDDYFRKICQERYHSLVKMAAKAMFHH